MKKQIDRKILFGMLLFTILFVSLIFTRKTQPHVNYDEMFDIAEQVQHSFDLVKEAKVSKGISLNDQSGMIGSEYTGITTTLGSHEAKMTTVNPNFSSVIYTYVKALQLKVGDQVAVNLSSSFPSLNIQTIIVLENMGLEPVIISSIGASTYGATDPEFTYLDMENMLFDRGVIHHKSVMVTPGGDSDLGGNMDRVLLENIFNRLRSVGYRIYIEKAYEANLETRLAMYKNCKVLINVGGNYMSFTGNDIGYERQYGIIKASTSYNYDDRGLIGSFLSRGQDVIHLLNIKGIAVDNNLPIDPKGKMHIASNGSFYVEKYSRVLLVFTFVFGLGLLVGYKYDKENRIKDHIKHMVKQEFMD